MRPEIGKDHKQILENKVSCPVTFTIFTGLPELIKYIPSCLSGSSSIKITFTFPLLQLFVKMDV